MFHYQRKIRERTPWTWLRPNLFWPFTSLIYGTNLLPSTYRYGIIIQQCTFVVLKTSTSPLDKTHSLSSHFSFLSFSSHNSSSPMIFHKHKSLYYVLSSLVFPFSPSHSTVSGMVKIFVCSVSEAADLLQETGWQVGAAEGQVPRRIRVLGSWSHWTLEHHTGCLGVLPPSVL